MLVGPLLGARYSVPENIFVSLELIYRCVPALTRPERLGTPYLGPVKGSG